MGRLTVLSLLMLVGACSYATQSSTAEPGTEVGGTGNLQVAHDTLGNNKQMVTVTAAPGLMETEGSIEQHIDIFANKFAARTCPDSYEFLNDATQAGLPKAS